MVVKPFIKINMDIEADLVGILSLLRTHIEIRNRSWMKRVHRDCFIGSDCVDFLVTQGLADSRKQGVEIGRKMVSKKMIRHVTDSRKKFQDAYLYYRFAEDDVESSLLAPINAGNGKGTFLGQGGCKWSFCPHTAHNSFILDIALAEDIERAVAGASIEARARAFEKLRARVREQAEPDAPDWILGQTTEVHNNLISIYQRKRPRGDFKNVKMTGMIGESAKGFIRGIMSFDKRKQWESMFEDGVIVEAIDIGEPPSGLFVDDDLPAPAAGSAATTAEALSLPDSQRFVASLARKTDDVLTFLQTVDLAGVPHGMCIGFLNDPERQHALAHLRKQMMLSNPEECMLCHAEFESPADIRFCPCCAMVSCAACVSKRVFEVVSRQVVSVCIHCYRESSRIRHPPQAVQDSSNVDEAVRGKWWRPEDLGMVDYSQSLNNAKGSFLDSAGLGIANATKPLLAGMTAEDIDLESAAASLSVASSVLTSAMEPTTPSNRASRKLAGGNNEDDEDDDDDNVDGDGDGLGDGVGRGINEADFVTGVTPLMTSPMATGKASTPTAAASSTPSEKTARCKNCGLMISRQMEVIEQHMAECSAPKARSASIFSPSRFSMVGTGIESLFGFGGAKNLAGITRKPELDRSSTRLIYRTARAQSKMYAPREVCCLQDAFMDPDGTCYVYEVSVRHCDVRGLPGYVTADVLLLMHVARPVKGSKSACNITIVSQVDTRAQGPQWLMSFITEELGDGIGVLGKDDLVRELRACGDLQNILKREQEEGEDGSVSLEDFELLAVLGRGGFGKVMQVRHIPTNEVYAMKILKKSELRRRRQVERTQTERTILAAVRHPFIVCLHYAFQNQQKLYMVMDFVQGGDFFTLMRKFKRLPEDWVRIYISEISMALQHLHDMDVVYRDLKPENILLCGDGHMKLTDFGLSRFFETRPPAAEDMIGDDDVLTRSFCGTEQYMSPEMLLQQGHNFRMDWWCVGLLMHEMISARHPFHGPSHYDTLRNMVTKQPNIDSRLSASAAAVVKGLLVKNPKTRLNCRDGMTEMKAMPFFASVDWEALYDKRVTMPYVPDLKNAMDISSFETTFTKEAAVDSVADQPNAKAKKGGNKGIMGLFGYGSSSTQQADDQNDNDVFKGFSFAKEEVAAAAAVSSPSSSIATPVDSSADSLASNN